MAGDLTAYAIPYYLPLVHQTRFHGKRKVRVIVPLFPGYVFVKCQREHLYLVDRTRRIANILEVADSEQLTWELANVRLALSSQACLTPHPRLVAGVRAEVKSGPFKGIQGIVERCPRPDRLFLQVNMLGRSMSIEIDPDLLVNID